jgi:hypothetical protein
MYYLEHLDEELNKRELIVGFVNTVMSLRVMLKEDGFETNAHISMGLPSVPHYHLLLEDCAW